ncbi:MAG: response regulator [Candidatus Eisenbacteria bacterium]|nr:response regulator [Candidatus Eisenbacteria bacterium]
MLEQKKYDLVFMDVQMPEMDGFEATRIIRSGDTEIEDPTLPIIAMTAHSLMGDREKCLKAGMNDYVSKPVQPKELSAVLGRWITHRSFDNGRYPPKAA